jgi:hypothetical protein
MSATMKMYALIDANYKNPIVRKIKNKRNKNIFIFYCKIYSKIYCKREVMR